MQSTATKQNLIKTLRNAGFFIASSQPNHGAFVRVFTDTRKRISIPFTGNGSLRKGGQGCAENRDFGLNTERHYLSYIAVFNDI